MSALAGLLVGAGHGRRAGGPKALRRAADGVLMWQVQVAALRAAGCDPVVAVLHPAALEGADVADLGAPWTLLAGDPDGSLFTSARLGLRWLAAATPGRQALLLPVDCPWPGAAVLDALQAAIATAPASWRAARPIAYDADALRWRGGHPLLLAPQAWRSLCDGPDETRLDHWLAALPASERLDVAVDEAAVLANLNGP